MEKIILGLVFLCVMCCLAGCGNNTSKKKLIAEIQQTLNQNDAQVLIALGNNFEAKVELIRSSELNSDGLIALCTNPEPMNLNNKTVRNWFKDAIERTELTAEQEVEIARIGEFAYSQALLLSTNLTADGLVAVCENPGDLNLNNKTVQNWFKDAIKRTELTAEQKALIAKSKTGGLGLF